MKPFFTLSKVLQNINIYRAKEDFLAYGMSDKSINLARDTEYGYIYIYMCVCIHIYIRIYPTKELKLSLYCLLRYSCSIYWRIHQHHCKRYDVPMASTLNIVHPVYTVLHTMYIVHRYYSIHERVVYVLGTLLVHSVLLTCT